MLLRKFNLDFVKKNILLQKLSASKNLEFVNEDFKKYYNTMLGIHNHSNKILKIQQYLPTNIAKNFNFSYTINNKISRKNYVYRDELKNNSHTTRRFAAGCAECSIKQWLFCAITEPQPSYSEKITIVGAGHVGMSIATSLLTLNVANNLVLLDSNCEKAAGEAMDMMHGASFVKNYKVVGGKDVALTAGSKIIIVTAGHRQEKEEPRLNLLKKNIDIFKKLIPALVKSSPNAIFIIVTNPVDVLTWATWKLSCLPVNRVIGSGCSLDSARFKYFISQKLGIAPSSVDGWVIGEHGDSSVAVWSGVNVASTRLRDILPSIATECDKEGYNHVHHMTIRAAYDVIKLKGTTNWAIAYSVSDIVTSILRNTSKVHCVSTNAQCQHAIEKEVFLSLPCSINEQGISYIVRQKLNEKEFYALHASADLLLKMQCSVKL